MANKIIHLGIARTTTNKHELKPENFPSTFGLNPVWIAKPPDTNLLRCGNCKGIMTFILQAYASIDENEEAYHRILYVFGCVKEKCAKTGKEVLVLRWQAKEDFEPIFTCAKEKGKKAYIIDVISEESEATEIYVKKTRNIMKKECKYEIEEQKNKIEDLEEIKEQLLNTKDSKTFEYENKLWKNYLEKKQLTPEEAELEQVSTI